MSHDVVAKVTAKLTAVEEGDEDEDVGYGHLRQPSQAVRASALMGRVEQALPMTGARAGDDDDNVDDDLLLCSQDSIVSQLSKSPPQRRTASAAGGSMDVQVAAIQERMAQFEALFNGKISASATTLRVMNERIENIESTAGNVFTEQEKSESTAEALSQRMEAVELQSGKVNATSIYLRSLTKRLDKLEQDDKAAARIEKTGLADGKISATSIYLKTLTKRLDSLESKYASRDPDTTSIHAIMHRLDEIERNQNKTLQGMTRHVLDKSNSEKLMRDLAQRMEILEVKTASSIRHSDEQIQALNDILERVIQRVNVTEKQIAQALDKQDLDGAVMCYEINFFHPNPNSVCPDLNGIFKLNGTRNGRDRFTRRDGKAEIFYSDKNYVYMIQVTDNNYAAIKAHQYWLRGSPRLTSNQLQGSGGRSEWFYYDELRKLKMECPRGTVTRYYPS